MTITSTLTAVDLSAAFRPDFLLSRIRFIPEPGTATEQDVLDMHRREKQALRTGRWHSRGEGVGFRNPSWQWRRLLLGTWVAQRNLGAVAGDGRHDAASARV